MHLSFTRSSGPIVGFREEEVLEMRASKLKELEKRLLEKRKELLNGVRTLNASRFETDSRTLDLADQAASAYTKEFLLSLGDAERRLLRQVDAALEKIRLRSYGKCEKCEKEIGLRRLEALPFAEYCIACQEEEERQ
ncbi:MAG: TraR/DksA family transcriptional regulator [candidate division NC10 bacterium]|nr:TraR/DksA family transcriptional regulator [candidate division NC10 bacterium]